MFLLGCSVQDFLPPYGKCGVNLGALGVLARVLCISQERQGTRLFRCGMAKGSLVGVFSVKLMLTWTCCEVCIRKYLPYPFKYGSSI